MGKRAIRSREGAKGAAQRKLDPVQREAMKRKFRELDKNGDGKLSALELRDLLQRGAKTKLSDRELKVMFRSVDKDGSGHVDFDEFVDYLWSSSGGDIDNLDAADVVFDVELPLGGGSLELGGKMGNVVIHPGFIPKLKTGWRAVAVNGEKLPPREAADEIERLNRCWQRCQVIFEVDEQSADKMAGAMEDNLTAASRELLAMLGVRDWSQIHLLSAEERQQVLQDKRLPGLLVDSKSVFAAALLLDIIPVDDYHMRNEIVDLLAADDPAGLALVLTKTSDKELLQRDGDGNVPLHLARGEKCCGMLVAKCPEAQMALNNAGRNPMNERLARHGRSCRVDLDEAAGMREILLHCDDRGICAAMRVVGEDFEAASRLLTPWEEICDALDQPPEFILPRLERLGGDEWPGLIGFHCFREVMQDGCHTSHSWTRLRTLWLTLSRLLKNCLHRDRNSLAPAKALLRATKGPCCPPIDMRLPYRKELTVLMEELNHESGSEVARQYHHLSGTGATWLKQKLEDELSETIVPNPLVRQGLQPRLRMDFQLESGTTAPEALRPDWIQSESPGFDQILADLITVGAVSSSCPQDAVFEMLRIAGMGIEDDVVPSPEDPDSLLPLLRLHAAYMRGVCRKYQEEVVRVVKDAVGDLVVVGRSFFPRPEVKGLPRIIVKTMEALAETKEEIKTKDIERDDETNFMLQQSAAFVNDIMGVTLVGDMPEDLEKFVDKIQSAMQVLRVKNTYKETHVSTETAYRDIKLWPCIETEIGYLLVEVQCILAEGFEAKKWMHMPYCYTRGDFDWRHGDGLSTDEEFFIAWRLYTGIDGEQEDDDLAEAKKCCILAAKGGHLVARGICHREGWGSRRKDDRKALADFGAAATAGLSEGKVKVGTSLLNSMTNVAANRRRGMELLLEAAEEGELEAFFQLGINANGFREQKEWLGKAAHMGHQRAIRHPLIATNSANKRISVLLDV